MSMISYSTFERDGQRSGETLYDDRALHALRGLGIEAGHFDRHAAPLSSTPMLSHARELLALQRRFDTVMIDHVRQRPRQGGKPFPPVADSRLSWPEPEHEHRHDDLEVRLLLDGSLRYLLRLSDGFAAVIFQPGTWFALPAGMAHTAQSNAHTGVDLLRLFSRPNGWAALATAATPPRRLLPWPVVHPPISLAA
jgi:hypothetical protein